MARYQSDLQPSITITGAMTQSGEFAVRVGNCKEGVAFLNIFKAPTNDSTIQVLTSSSDLLGNNPSGENYWVVAGSTATGTTTGTKTFPITNLGEVIVWRCLGTPVEMTFSLTIYLSDIGASAASPSLQGAYDEGRTISTSDPSGGPVQITRDSPTASHAALHVRDTNTQPGRTEALVLVEDANSGTGPVASLVKTAAGALGLTLTLLHDSASPAASDELCRLTFQGRDSGANLTEYCRLSAVLVDPTNTSEDGELQLHVMGAGTLRQALALRSPAGEAQLSNGLAPGSAPPFRFTATSDYSASQAVLRIEDNNGSDILLTVRGDGTTEIGVGQASAGSASGHLLAIKKHTGFSGSESKATTGVQTTSNATQTPLWSFTLADNTVYWFEANVAARRTAGGATADRAGYRLFCCVFREAAGGATLVGTVVQDARESVVGWDATFTVSGNDLRLSVTGEASRTIQWAATIGWQGVSTS